jgi:hypothetical protein
MNAPKKRGAPPKPDDAKRALVHVSMMPGVAEGLREIAAELGYATSRYVEVLARHAISEHAAGRTICAPGDRPRKAAK